jgi:uncharacterized membrane protein
VRRAPLAAKGRLLALAGGEPLVLVLAAGSALAYAGFAAIQQGHFHTGFDLAIFDQAVWHYSNFDAPASSIKGIPNLLGDHFSPIIALLSPLYWVWSDPRALLAAQGALIAASIVPVFLFARRRLPRWPALAIAVSYALFWGIQTGATFEFHEVAFAPLTIGLAILWADERRWLGFAACMAALLLTKEDLSLLVFFFGVYLLSLRHVRAGAATCAAGLGWYLLATKVFIPHYAPAGGGFTYWSYTRFGDGLFDSLGTVITKPWLVPQVAFETQGKSDTIVYLFAAFLFLSLGSRLAILTIPLLAERFLSDNPTFWTTQFHYSLAIAPVLAMAAAAGLANLSAVARIVRRAPWLTNAAAVALIPAGLWVGHLAHAFPLVNLVKPGFYEAPAYSGPVRRALDRIPPKAGVAAQDSLLPHLTHRDSVAEIAPTTPPTPYTLGSLSVHIGAPTGNSGGWPQFDHELSRRIRSGRVIFREGGWVVVRRRR